MRRPALAVAPAAPSVGMAVVAVEGTMIVIVMVAAVAVVASGGAVTVESGLTEYLTESLSFLSFEHRCSSWIAMVCQSDCSSTT